MEVSPSSLGRAGCFQYLKSLDIGGGGKEHHGNGFMELYVVHNFRDAGLFGATVSHSSHRLLSALLHTRQFNTRCRQSK